MKRKTDSIIAKPTIRREPCPFVQFHPKKKLTVRKISE